MNKSLTAEAKFLNYPLFILIWAGLTAVTAVLIKTGNSAVLVLLLGGLTWLSLYRPKWFLYLAITLLLTRSMFVMQAMFDYNFKYLGHGAGPLILGNLRWVMPDSPVYYNIPRAIFLAAFIRLVVLFLRKGSGSLVINKRLAMAYGFVLMTIISAIANGAFGKNTLNFIMFLSMPMVFYYYIKSIHLTRKEKQYLFAYILFNALEIQLIISWINNWDKLLAGNFFYGDWAIGTFVFPQSENSGFLLAIALFTYLYRFMINRRGSDIALVLAAFYGVLSIASILYILAVGAFVIGSLGFAYAIRVIKIKELMLSVLALMVLSMPAVWIFSNPELYYDGEHAQQRMAETSRQEIWEIPKIYSFVNLANMMITEDRLVFGSGPATFMSRFATGGYIFKRYNSYAVLKKSHLSSSEMLNNSFVAIFGEVGPLGYLFFFLFFYGIYRELQGINSKRIRHRRPPLVEAIGVNFSLLFFFALSFLKGPFESETTTVPLLILASLVLLQNKQDRRSLARRILAHAELEEEEGRSSQKQ